MLSGGRLVGLRGPHEHESRRAVDEQVLSVEQQVLDFRLLPEVALERPEDVRPRHCVLEAAAVEHKRFCLGEATTATGGDLWPAARSAQLAAGLRPRRSRRTRSPRRTRTRPRGRRRARVSRRAPCAACRSRLARRRAAICTRTGRRPSRGT